MKKFALLLVLMVVFIQGIQTVKAGNIINLRSTINPGTLIASVRDKSGVDLLSPIVDFGRVVNSVDCREAVNGLQGTLGTDDQRLYIDNPKAANNGWTLTLAPLDASAASWDTISNSKMDINDYGDNGCTDSDGDGAGGLMFIDPQNGTIKTNCLECTSNNLYLGAAGNFSTSKAITLLGATEQADHLGSWYLTGVQIRQSIPEGQEGGIYNLQLTLTATST